MFRLPALLLLLASAAAPAAGLRFADAHLHYVDFFQETEGMDALFEAMDAARVDEAVLMGVPVAKKWDEDEPKRPRYYEGDDAPLYWYSATDALLAEAVRALPPARRARLHPFLSGFNPNDKNADAHVARMLDLYPDVFVGIGEVFTRHDTLTALTQGRTPRIDSEAMQRVYRLAAERGLPVLVHANLTSVREREPLYLGEVEAALAAHPRTTFIWAHAGTSAAINRRQGEMPYLLPVLRRLMDAHDNLVIDLSWSVLDHVLDDEGAPRPEWLELVQAHPRRFVLGSDVVGRFGSLGDKFEAFAPLLDALPPDVARGLARDNLRALLARGAPAGD
ncbi:amidohydrolase family protein [Coralloluteibacterium thermophilus]|uniref:Amidohydrolase family protein n=1 Tax=Coralloluteibacterium thermophilum TaxID=2707049 RepID=A0ABV9NMY7_9GAMM